MNAEHAYPRQFADLLARLAGDRSPALRAAAWLAAAAAAAGHTCVRLADAAGAPVPGADMDAPDLAAWRAALAQSPAVACGGERRPLVLEGDLLYLHRYRACEQAVADDLRARARPRAGAAALDDALAALFPHAEEAEQRAAAACAATRGFAVISGGPGTGKTTTLARLIAALAAVHGAGLRVRVAAPTGKAAARVEEALREARARLPSSHAGIALPPATTLHRLLGARPDTVRMRHGAQHPLALDLLAVDEASMVDLALMAKLLAALPPAARLVLLGDKDQLASVEAGAVLADICAAGDAGPLAGSVALLARSRRFRAEGGIGALARAVNAGDAQAAIGALRAGDPALGWHAGDPGTALAALLAGDAGEGMRRMVLAARAGDGAGAFAAWGEQRLLTALREGPLGERGLNARIESWLAAQGLARPDAWYPGRPVLVTRNDHGLGLYNGDIGIAMPGEQGLGVMFPAAGGTRRVGIARLPQHQSAWAMTVHKAQGSEAACVVLVLPPAQSPALCRELLYTGITRASERLVLCASEQALGSAVARPLRRASGLAARLRAARLRAA